MRRSRQQGFTLLEVIVAMSIFGVFLYIVFSLTSDMRGWEKRLPVNFMRNPQVMSVVARMRRDVMDLHPPTNDQIYVKEFQGYENGAKTLIVQAQFPDKGGLKTIVWDLSQPGVAKRIVWNVGNIESEWTARGLPEEFSSNAEFDAVKFAGRHYAVRLIAKDADGKIAIDQIMQPRAYQ
ncbi:MAG TPA: prepilin-type N-terminal cleavage/methylation domain-containing protein [Thermoanaerobaculia bacterium]|nr:prepilin-type N-terminal cleavage/methylation domain-containing protein [Thermoanaerobaculia bacterium]